MDPESEKDSQTWVSKLWKELKALCRQLREKNTVLAWLDEEGGEIFEMVDEELIILQDVEVDTLY